AQHPRHVVVQLEMLAGGPLTVNLLRAGVEIRSRPAHAFDDLARVDDEQLVGVAIVAAVEEWRRRRDRLVKPFGVDIDAVAGARRLLSPAGKSRAGGGPGPQ